MYHSATPRSGDEYREKVQVVWPEEQRVAGLVGATPLAQAWAATIATRPPGFCVCRTRSRRGRFKDHG